MLQRFRDRFGTAGLIIAVVALIAALAGTAIAAGGLNPKQKKEVTKIAKKYAGKPGAPGAPGPKGDKGDKGDAGAAGNNGNNGNNGKDGNSVVVTAEPKGANCESGNGGIKVTVENVAGTKYVCDGETGFTETLPPGKTETGTWSAQGEESFSGGFLIKEISFPIPVVGAITPVFVGVKPADKTKGEGEGCPGPDAEGSPTADPGTLCVYLNSETGTFEVLGFGDPTAPFGSLGVKPSGTVLVANCKASPCLEYGTWAVTAPTA